MTSANQLQYVEAFYYELKPALGIALAITVLLSTSWGIWSLVIPLALLYYSGAILLLRHRFRGSFKDWLTPLHRSLLPKDPSH